MKYETIDQLMSKIESMHFKNDSILLVEGSIPVSWFDRLQQKINKHRKLIGIDYPRVHQPFYSGELRIYVIDMFRLKAMRDSLKRQIQIIETENQDG